jgi:uncharacterized protein YjbI with pentapeptide repeats
MTQTTASAFDKRWNFIRTLWQDNRWLFVFAGWMFGLLTFPLLQLIDTNWRGLLYNLVPEAVGITFTVLILNRLAENRARIELQKRLVREARSQSNETAKAAVDWLRAKGWLTLHDNALLKKADLYKANLQGADLTQANLQGAGLDHANLQGADLTQANLQGAGLDHANLQAAKLWATNLQAAKLRVTNLQGANLWNASLQGANLMSANLEQADLVSANLHGANLEYASLQGANLMSANLHGAKLGQAKLQGVALWDASLQGANLMSANLHGAKNIETATFDEKTVLPDANLLQDEKGDYRKDVNGNYIYDKYWTLTTDMTRYTNPKHPDFWEMGFDEDDSG